MKFHAPVFLFLVVLTLSPAAEPTPAIAALASPDIVVRRAAVEAIQTLDDPAIPAACLPLLKDEGVSIRRQAARAIGSRFFQIPEIQKKTYLAALKESEAMGPADNALICQRAIGLLTGNFSFPSFSVGPRKKWVLYERRKLPVITLVKHGNHELLSPVWPGENELLKMAITNEPAQELFSPHWHSSGEAVAFTMILQRRFFHPIFIWSFDAPEVKVLEPRSLKPLLPPRYPNWGTTSDFVKWDGTKVIVRIYDCDSPDGPPPNDPGVLISYDIKTRGLARVAK